MLTALGVDVAALRAETAARVRSAPVEPFTAESFPEGLGARRDPSARADAILRAAVDEAAGGRVFAHHLLLALPAHELIGEVEVPCAEVDRLLRGCGCGDAGPA